MRVLLRVRFRAMRGRLADRSVNVQRWRPALSGWREVRSGARARPRKAVPLPSSRMESEGGGGVVEDGSEFEGVGGDLGRKREGRRAGGEKGEGKERCRRRWRARWSLCEGFVSIWSHPESVLIVHTIHATVPSLYAMKVSEEGTNHAREQAHLYPLFYSSKPASPVPAQILP